MLDFTVYRLTLREIAVVLAGEESISVSSHYAFDIPFTLRSALKFLLCYYNVPAIDIEEEAFHVGDCYRCGLLN